MGDILDYISVEEPDVYERTRYRIVEISERLQGLQRGRATGGDGKAAMKGTAQRRGHSAKVEVLGGSIFDWERVVPEPCFFLALEVLVRLALLLSRADSAQDNFAHDVVRYTTLDHEPLQCVVSIDGSGDYTELYEPVSDPLIARYLKLRQRLPQQHRRSPVLNPLLAASPLLRQIAAAVPFAPNLTAPEFLPTKQLMLLDILRDKFPAHRILFSDFSSLPDAIPGKNAPVVQTRYEGEVSGPLCRMRELTCRTADGGLHDVPRPARFLRHLLPDRLSSPARPLLPRHGSQSLQHKVSRVRLSLHVFLFCPNRDRLLFPAYGATSGQLGTAAERAQGARAWRVPRPMGRNGDDSMQGRHESDDSILFERAIHLLSPNSSPCSRGECGTNEIYIASMLEPVELRLFTPSPLRPTLDERDRLVCHLCSMSKYP